MNKEYNYFIILIISIIICYFIYRNTNNNREKFSSQFESVTEIKKDCPVGDIVYGFCNNICTYYNDDEKEYCTKECPPAVKKYLIDSPDNIYTNFLLKYIWKGKKEIVDKQLNDVQTYLIQQTEIAQAMQQLSNPGSKWKEIEDIEESSLDQTKNLEKHINDNILDDIEKQKQLNILNKLKESIITNKRAFHYTSDPTFNEIVSIIPSKDSSDNKYSIDDKYNFWIEINIEDSDGNISKRFFKPHNFKCYNRIDELLVENNFIKLNNKKLGYLWKIYDVKPNGTKISSTYNIKQLFKRKFNDIKPNRWYEFIKTTTSDDLIDTNNLEVIANDSAFISWLKLLISIKSPIKESNTFDSNDKKYIYQLALNEQKVITDLSNKAGISKFKFDNYIIIDEKYYRPQGDILLSKDEFDSTFTSRVIKNLDLDSYIEFNYEGNKLYLKVVPPLILNSDLKEKCNKSGYKNKDEYTAYNSDNIMSKINDINNININEINDVIVENADSDELNTTQKILDALNSKYPDKDIYNTDSYFNKEQVLSLWSSWTKELETRVKEEKERREIINNNCKYTDVDVATWDSSKNIIDMGSGINYGQIKDPTENIQDIDNYYIKNSDINTVNNDKDDVIRNCAFNKTDVSNWRNKKKIDLKAGLSYGQIKDPTQNIQDIDNYYIKNSKINTVNKEKNDADANCAFNKTDVSNWKNKKKIDFKSGLSYGQIKNPTQNIQDIDQYYITNSDINIVNNEKDNVIKNCAFNKSEVNNWKNKKKLDLKSGLSYGQIKDPTQNITDIDEYYIKNENIRTKQNEIINSCLVDKNKAWGNSIDISSTKYGKIKNPRNNGFLIKTDETSRTDYLSKSCHIQKKAKDKWGTIGDTPGKYGKIKTSTNDGEYGEIGVDLGKYGLIYEEHGGPYGLINKNDKCQPGQDNKNCRKDTDYISLNKCNTDHLSKKTKKVSDTNSVLAQDIASAETVYKKELANMMDDWYKIDDAFCIFNEKKNRYDKCISDHKEGNILSYSEFKNTDADFISNLKSQKQKGISDAVRDFTNKYKTGPAKGKNCLPGNPLDYTDANSCTHLQNGANLECKDTSFNKTQAELTDAISSQKDSLKQSIIDKGFDDNIKSYANKYSNGNQCYPSTNVPEDWRPESSPCKDSGKSCGNVCPFNNCPTGKSCIPKFNTITESEMTFEDSTDLNQENAYKKAYDAAKAKWMGKYNDESTCKPKENVNPNEWKFQDSDDVCGGNAKCFNVNNALDEINKSSDIANQYACNKLKRNSCKVMNIKYNDCVNKKVYISCPRGEEPDTSDCSTNGTTICKACPNCGSNKYRDDNGVPTKDSNGKYIYCGTCKKCGTGKNIGKYDYIQGCNGLNSGTVKSCIGKTCPGIQVIVGCNKDGSPICENPTECSTSQFRQGRTKTVKGTCTPKTKCETTHYLNGFVKATLTTDGKNGICKQCVTCPDQKYLSGCSDTTGPGQCLTMTCGDCSDSAQIKLGCVRSSSPSSNTFNPKCKYCKPGQRKDGNKCVPCTTGKYSSGSRPINCTPCNTCSDVGLKTNNCASPGSAKNNVCHNKPNCSSGKYASFGNPPSCSPCPANTQQPISNNNEGIGSCLSCDNISYSSAGSSTCQQRNCDANNYVEPKEGGGAICKRITSNLCSLTCPSNQIKIGCKKQSARTNMQQLNLVQTNCTTCGAGKYKTTATSCSKKICTCPQNGTRAEGTNCPTHGQTKCQTCNNGYVKSGNTCALKRCSCPDGTPTTGVTCANGQNCSACNTGFYLSPDKKRCILNACTCSNGVGYTGTNCPTHAATKCRGCHKGWRLVGNDCIPNICTCTNGIAATGAACGYHNAHICKSCNGDKVLKYGICKSPPAPPSCPSNHYWRASWGTCLMCNPCFMGVSSSTCPSNGQKICTSCNTGYKMRGTICVKDYSYTPPPATPAPPPCKRSPTPGRCGGHDGKCNRFSDLSKAYCSNYGYCGKFSTHGRGSSNSAYNSDNTMCAIA